MTYTQQLPESGGTTIPAERISARARLLRLFWSCLGLGLLALVVLVWLFGLTWWVILVAAFVIACPAIAAWILLGGLDANEKPPRA